MLLTLLLACPVQGSFDSKDGTDTDSGGGGELPALRAGIPAYIYPGGADWDAIHAAEADVALVIANPASGPGSSADAAWQAEIEESKSAGVKVLGYVPTTYGERSVDDVVAEIQQWAEWYTPGGIFFDQVPAGDKCESSQQDYYSMMAAAREMIPEAVVAMNWGTLPCQTWMNEVDVAVEFEGAGADLMAWEPAEWVKDYPPEKFWVLAHTTSAEDEPAAIEHVRARNVRYVYVTDDVLDNPWDTVPTYWAAEVDHLTP